MFRRVSGVQAELRMMTPYYQDEAVTIYHGDCRQVLPGLESVDLLLTDPPYGLGENAKRVASRGNLAAPTDYGEFNWDVKINNDLLLSITRKASRAIVWGGNYYDMPPARGWLIWDKVNGSNDFADCEMAWTNLDQATRMFRHMWNGMIRDSERGIPRLHPCQKPLPLMTWCLGFAPAAKTVLDPFAGSFTTLRAAKDKGLKAIGIDLDERNCEIGARRMSQEVLNFGA